MVRINSNDDAHLQIIHIRAFTNSTNDSSSV